MARYTIPRTAHCDSGALMTRYRTLAERQAARLLIREAAIARAERAGLTLRCDSLRGNMDDPGHRACRGEEPGNSGCLCRCHDRKFS